MNFFQPKQSVAKANRADYTPWNAMTIKRKKINCFYCICIKL